MKYLVVLAFLITAIVAQVENIFLEKINEIELKDEDGIEVVDFASDFKVINSNNLVLTDKRANQLICFNEFGAIKWVISSKGNGPGDLNRPTSLFLTDNSVIVKNERNNRLDYFDFDGKYKKSKKFSEKQLILISKTYDAIDSEGNYYSTTSGFNKSHLIEKFDQDLFKLKNIGKIETEKIKWFDFSEIEKNIKNNQIPSLIINSCLLATNRDNQLYAIHPMTLKLKKYDINGKKVFSKELKIKNYKKRLRGFFDRSKEIVKHRAISNDYILRDFVIDDEGSIFVLIKDENLILYKYSKEGRLITRYEASVKNVMKVEVHNKKLYVLTSENKIVWFNLKL
ncbi:MAG: hypothetical protein ACEPO8_09560 [Rhodothermaceae bacterium]